MKLLDMVPRDVKAIIFLFPDNKNYTADRQAEDIRLTKIKQEKLDPTIFWMKQTVCCNLYLSSFRSHPIPQIGNACGTMALIHAIANVRLITRVSIVAG
jgi:ubiquitin carboxyl-terminal hydrolase L3